MGRLFRAMVVLVAAVLAGCGCPEGVSPCGTTCVDLEFDPFNCGACGTHCDPWAAIGTCHGGTCRILKCARGYADADGDPATGCERYVGVSPK
ncbi:MAG: hypothetical protein ACYC8T_29850 [Myxococcaceae bacterium]